MDISSHRYSKNTGISVQLFFTMKPAYKKLIRYFLLVLLSALLIAFLFNLGDKTPAAVYTKKIGYLFTLLLIGIGHIFIFPTYLKESFGENKQLLCFNLAISLMIFIASFFLFYLMGTDKTQWALAGSCSFLLPFSIQFSWKYFNAIAEVNEFIPWKLPLQIPERKVSIFLNSIQIRLNLRLHKLDQEPTLFLITVPGRLKFGEVFHRFLTDKASECLHIELYDKKQQPFEWKFTLHKLLGDKMINPDISVSENGINTGDIIEAARMTD